MVVLASLSPSLASNPWITDGIHHWDKPPASLFPGGHHLSLCPLSPCPDLISGVEGFGASLFLIFLINRSGMQTIRETQNCSE